MLSSKQLSATGLSLALSLAGLAGGCATTKGAEGSATAEKGAEHSCGEGKCGGEKAAPAAGAEEAKGAEHACGEGSCGGGKTAAPAEGEKPAEEAPAPAPATN